MTCDDVWATFSVGCDSSGKRHVATDVDVYSRMLFTVKSKRVKSEVKSERTIFGMFLFTHRDVIYCI